MRERLFWILKNYGVKDRIAKAFLEVPRESFLMKRYPLSYVYEDVVLVSYDDGEVFSTSSQPSLMAMFMEWVELSEGMKVLEVGGGTGYNAAVMSKVVGDSGLIVSIEYSEKICKIAEENLKKLGIENVIVICGDGYYGVPDFAPYDVVFVTVGVDEIPDTWFEQMHEKSRVIVPINLKLSGRQPAFLFSKASPYLVGGYKLETRFIKAGGKLGNLLERNKKFLKEFPLSKVISISRPFLFLELVDILTRKLTKIDGRFYYVDDRGAVEFLNGEIRIYGEATEIENLLSQWERCGYRGFEHLTLHIGYNAFSRVSCSI
ncbi:protein-L-isoaspartate O-methyltransferase [Thermotoga sp. KOL6]|uniref:protein-L-isoaspartate O-methyltransferase n=1 Tax=Thermotoga sp. KOL6 TaxID=126741 RepID=UPI000C78FB8C|nr:protein-L-isoaspartate O-methyltransferase [Thermotoga sp. KOL6]PLV59404.1 protein-L-isoaspartate O-methyltransferase [Thermotoga sp. KOL6]